MLLGCLVLLKSQGIICGVNTTVLLTTLLLLQDKTSWQNLAESDASGVPSPPEASPGVFLLLQGKILIGLTPEGGQRSAADVTKFGSFEQGQGGGGIMLFALHDSGINALAQAACNVLKLSSCSTPVLPGAT